MAKKSNRVVLLAKIEATEGTDPVPVVASDAMLANIKNVQPLVTETAQRDLTRPFFGATGVTTVAQSSMIEFDVEYAGSGAAGTAPAFKSLLLACATSENVTLSVKVDYALITDSTKTVTLYYYLDGLLHKFIGCRGNASFQLNAKGIPVISFKFWGTYTAATDDTFPAITGTTYNAFKDPMGVNKTNTPTLTLHTVALNASSVSFDLGNNIVVRNLIGLDAIDIVGRNTTGSVTFEMTSVATKAWHEDMRLNTIGAFALTHGVGAGKIIEVTSSKVQINSLEYSDQDGVKMCTAGLTFIPAAGSDELLITFK